MSELYSIKWSDKVTGRSGQGSFTFPKEQAESIARDLSFDYPDTVYEAVRVTAAQPTTPQLAAEPLLDTKAKQV